MTTSLLYAVSAAARLARCDADVQVSRCDASRAFSPTSCALPCTVSFASPTFWLADSFASPAFWLRSLAFWLADSCNAREPSVER